MEYLAIKNMSLFLCMGNLRGGCFPEAEDLTAPYIPSSRIRDGFRFRVAPCMHARAATKAGQKVAEDGLPARNTVQTTPDVCHLRWVLLPDRSRDGAISLILAQGVMRLDIPTTICG